jgi:hypothetical protein
MSEEREVRKEIVEIEVQVFMTRCPLCHRKVYALTEVGAHSALVEHLNREHYYDL